MMFKYVLIFGKFGLPKLGANGAAIATCIARFAELGALIIWINRHKLNLEYMRNVFKGFKVPKALALEMFKKMLPLAVNESLWAIGIAAINQCYAHKGLAVVAGLNISTTLTNVFTVSFVALGMSISVVIGQHLGAGNIEQAIREDRQMIAFSVAFCVLVGAVMACFAGLFPQIYNTEPEVRALATKFIIISACVMPLNAYTNASYFTLRSGGKTLVTFIFDSGYTWTLLIPLAYVLTKYTNLPIVVLFAIVQSMDFVKCVIGYIMLKKKTWVKNLVA